MQLQDLPSDLFFAISYFLDPLDVISIRQTCRYLYALSLERSVWITAMKQVVHDDHVYSRNYNLQKMSISQLEEASTTSSRFMRKILAGCVASDPNPSKVSYTSMRSIHTIHAPGDPNTAVQELYPIRTQFIPGGRFMLVISPNPGEPEPVTVRVLDLDPPNGNDCEVYAEWKYYGDHSVTPRQSSDGQELMIAMSRIFNTSEVTVFRIISNGNHQPQIVSHTTSPLVQLPGFQNPFLLFTFTDDYFVYIYRIFRGHNYEMEGYKSSCSFHVVIWNFKEDTGAQWQLDDFWYKQMFVDSGHIIFVTDHLLMGWKIPELFCMKESLTRIEEYTVSFTCEYKGGHALQYLRMADWYYPRQSPATFDTIYFDTAGTLSQTYRHYTGVPISEHATSHEPGGTAASNSAQHRNRSVNHVSTTKFPETMGYINHFGRPGGEITICNNRRVALLNDEQELYVLSTPLYVEASTNPDTFTNDASQSFICQLETDADYPLFLDKDRPDRWISFDAASGRLAYIPRNDASIVLLEYVEKRGRKS